MITISLVAILLAHRIARPRAITQVSCRGLALVCSEMTVRA